MRKRKVYKRIAIEEDVYKRLLNDRDIFQTEIGGGKWSISDTLREYMKTLDYYADEE